MLDFRSSIEAMLESCPRTSRQMISACGIWNQNVVRRTIWQLKDDHVIQQDAHLQWRLVKQPAFRATRCETSAPAAMPALKVGYPIDRLNWRWQPDTLAKMVSVHTPRDD